MINLSLTSEAFLGTLGTEHSIVYSYGHQGFVIESHVHLGAFQETRAHAAMALARQYNIKLADDDGRALRSTPVREFY